MTDSSRTREHLEVLADALATPPGEGREKKQSIREGWVTECACGAPFTNYSEALRRDGSPATGEDVERLRLFCERGHASIADGWYLPGPTSHVPAYHLRRGAKP